MIIENNIPTDFCRRDARSLRPLIINKLAAFYFGHTSRVFLHLRVYINWGIYEDNHKNLFHRNRGNPIV